MWIPVTSQTSFWTETILPALKNVALHVLVDILCAEVNIGSEHLDPVVLLRTQSRRQVRECHGEVVGANDLTCHDNHKSVSLYKKTVHCSI